jgi:WS/DGAT/MGAT family acyltransferase
MSENRHRPERLSALDASFLYAETPATPMHVGALLVFEGAPFFDERGAFRLDDVRRRIEARLHRVPRMRKVVRFVPFGQGRPVWVDAVDFDIADHVRLMVLPEPGNRAQLEALCERLQMQVLDRSKPLWELWCIGGLADGNVAMVEKLHHAMVDGISGVDVASALLDLEPRTGPEPIPPWNPEPPPSDLELVFDAWRDQAREPLELARLAGSVARAPLRLARGAVEGLGSLLSLVGPGGLAPRTSLNAARVGSGRRLLTVRVPLDEVKATKRWLGTTVNDVVLAAVTGGLRRLLEAREEPVEGFRLRALVPVSVRADDEHLALGNRVSAMVAPLPIDEETPLARLLAVQATMSELKAQHLAEGNELLLEGAEHLPPALTALVSRQVHRQPFVNVVVTNVPGPQFPLWFLGARMLESTPIVPLSGNLTVGIAVLSYDGTLFIGIHADRDAVPDVGFLADAIRDEFAELLRLARGGEVQPEPAEL